MVQSDSDKLAKLEKMRIKLEADIAALKGMTDPTYQEEITSNIIPQPVKEKIKDIMGTGLVENMKVVAVDSNGHKSETVLERESNQEETEKDVETIEDIDTPLPPVGQSTLGNMLQEVQNEKSLGEKLYEENNIEMITRLNPELVVQMSVAKMFARNHDLPEVEEMLLDIMKMRVSLMGEGRKEGVEMTRGALSGLMDPQVMARIKG